MGLLDWGGAISKIAEYVPGRKEKLRRDRRLLQEKLDRITKRKDGSPGDYIRIARKLQQVEDRIAEMG